MPIMTTPESSNKLANTSLTLGIIGWVIYIGQWCFDLTLGLFLAAVTAGASAACATILDFLPFVLWLVGVVTGHAALSQLKQIPGPGRGKAIGGLVLNYSGLFFIVALIVLIVVLLALGIGTGWLEKLIPISPNMIPGQSG
jgi:hypothetical protein